MALAPVAPPTFATAFNLAHDFSGPSFFDGWDFYGSWDNLTLSNVIWVDEADATAQKLAYVNDAGKVIMRVDNTTNVMPVDNAVRNTVRITTKESYDFGSLWVFDANHVPYGCSVWPAFWTKGPVWPDNGEIDILEAVNLMPDNQMAIHTTDGCTTNAQIVQTGELGSMDCASNSGCTVKELKPNSFGAGFAQAGGGVWATQFDLAGINIWFWSRADVPAALTQNTSSIDISTWGPPSASFPTSADCEIPKLFTPQQIVIDIALCGVWAGPLGNYQQTCDGMCQVTGPGSPAYDEAYFDINYVRAYTTGPGAPTQTATPASSTTAATVITSMPTQSSSETTTNAGRRVGASAGVVALVCSVLGTLLFV